MRWAMIAILFTFLAAVRADAGEVGEVREPDPVQREVRSLLEEQGVTFEVVYTGELLANLCGGLRRRSAGEGLLDIAVDLDLEKLGLFANGRFLVTFQGGHGNGITEGKVGDLQTVSNIDAEDDFGQVNECWWEQSLFDAVLRLKLGKQDANVDFCACEYAGDLINSSFGVSPNVPMPTFPDPALGAVLCIAPVKWLTIAGGIYDGAGEGGEWGFRTAFDGQDGNFSVGEIRLHHDALGGGELPGTITFGAWLHTGDFEELQGDREFGRNHGCYLCADQLLLAGEPGEGLGMFLQAGWAPHDRNEIPRYLGAGLCLRGTFPGRSEDVLAFGVAHAEQSSRLPGLGAETVFELSYKFQLFEGAVLQPDIQFVVDPGGDGDDALVVGLRFELTF